MVREFLRNDLNCAFPGDKNTTNKRKIYDLKNIGFINDAHGKQVDLFNLAPGTKLAQINLDTLKTRGIKIENIKSVEKIYAGGKMSDSDLELITHLNAKKIYLESADLSNVTKLNFGNAENIHLSFTKGLHGELDFTKIAPNAKEIKLVDTDLSNVTEIKIKDPKIIHGVDINTLQKLIIVGATNKLNTTEQQSNNKKIIVPKHPVHS